jgi:hypothetical protein
VDPNFHPWIQAFRDDAFLGDGCSAATRFERRSTLPRTLARTVGCCGTRRIALRRPASIRPNLTDGVAPTLADQSPGRCWSVSTYATRARIFSAIAFSISGVPDSEKASPQIGMAESPWVRNARRPSTIR